MNESELQKVSDYPIYPRDSRKYSNKGFVNIDNGEQGGFHSTAFYVVKISYQFNLILSEELQINLYLSNYLNQ